ncbi:MAG: 5-carboxymethyl-2-hydroxymuconate semialdehyde dehydrogenase [Acidimicrobiales bacterium]
MPVEPAPTADDDTRAVRAPAGVPERIDHYIDGKMLPSASGERFSCIDPVTNDVYATVAAGDARDVDRAVRAARHAFESGEWCELEARDRARVLRRVAETIEALEDVITTYEVFDTGLPVRQVQGQARRAAENFAFFADMIVSTGDEAYRVGTRQLNYVVRKPVGVAGLVTPWNTPFMLATWKLAPALASGCTVVLKPAEWTPLSATLLPGIMETAGLPAGAFNIVHGIGETAGAALVAHPEVPLISFTGETVTGQEIMRNASRHLKGLSMELGGKSPCIVFADADFDAAVDSALFGVFSLNGERCTAPSRILVEQDVYGRFVEELGNRARGIVVGLPEDPVTQIGALVHPEHHERVLSYVELGKSSGARLVAGGTRPAHLPRGNFISATVFADVDASMRIFQEEIFGPVVCVTPFSCEEEAIQLANLTRYGLAAYIWTNDLRRAHRVAYRVETGMAWVNSHNVRDLRTPFGGIKMSGLGREGGRYSIDFYTEARTVHLGLGVGPNPRL